MTAAPVNAVDAGRNVTLAGLDDAAKQKTRKLEIHDAPEPF